MLCDILPTTEKTANVDQMFNNLDIFPIILGLSRMNKLRQYPPGSLPYNSWHHDLASIKKLFFFSTDQG